MFAIQSSLQCFDRLHCREMQVSVWNNQLNLKVWSSLQENESVVDLPSSFHSEKILQVKAKVYKTIALAQLVL